MHLSEILRKYANKDLTRRLCSVTFPPMHNDKETPTLSVCFDGFGRPSHFYLNGKSDRIRFMHPARPRYGEVDAAGLKRFKKIIGSGNFVYVPLAHCGNCFHDIEEALEALAKTDVA
jgi:hypothetical protein